MSFIDAPAVGQILKEEFMVPKNLSSSTLAYEIHVSLSRIQAILDN